MRVIRELICSSDIAVATISIKILYFVGRRTERREREKQRKPRYYPDFAVALPRK